MYLYRLSTVALISCYTLCFLPLLLVFLWCLCYLNLSFVPLFRAHFLPLNCQALWPLYGYLVSYTLILLLSFPRSIKSVMLLWRYSTSSYICVLIWQILGRLKTSVRGYARCLTTVLSWHKQSLHPKVVPSPDHLILGAKIGPPDLRFRFLG